MKEKTRNKIKNYLVIIAVILVMGTLSVLPAGLPGSTFTVEAASKIKLNKTNIILIKGQNVQLKVIGTKGKTVWTSANKKVAVVNNKGIVTAKGKGTTTVKAKINKKIYTCKVQVETPRINKNSLILCKGTTYSLKLLGTRQKVKWKSSKTSIVSVNSSGKIMAKAKGTAIISAEVNNKKYTCKVLVETPKLNKTSVTLYENGSYTLKVLGTKQKVIWKSSDITVASVNNNGKITAKTSGTAIITATVANKKYTCEITVKKKVVLNENDKIPSCVDKQIVYVIGESYKGKIFNRPTEPDNLIYMKNLDVHAQIVDIKSSNSCIRARKRMGSDAIEVDGNGNVDLVGKTSIISWKVIQNGKTYELSCRVEIKKKESPFTEFKIGTEDVAYYFDGSGIEKMLQDNFKGDQTLSIKLKSNYILDKISVTYGYWNNGDYEEKIVDVESESKIDWDHCERIYVGFHMKQKPINYTPPSGGLYEPLNDFCALYIYLS